MRTLSGALFFLVGLPAAHAGDLADALRLTREVMGDEAIEGYEEFVDDEPTEALSILLSRRVEGRSEPPPFRRGTGARLDYLRLASFIEAAAQETGLPVALIDAVIRTESGYRPHVVSRAGAVGLMQLMPATARALGVRDPFDPAQNIQGGARYLRRLLDRFGQLELAVAAYNAGPGRVAQYGGIPPFRETRRYVQVVLERFAKSPLRR